MKKLKNFYPQEREMLRSCVEDRAAYYWSCVESIEQHDDSGLWHQALDCAESWTALLSKIEKLSNFEYPPDGPFPNQPDTPESKYLDS